jgi:hypothetical protein
MPVLLYIYMATAGTNGGLAYTWVFSGTYTNPAACHIAAENLRLLAPQFRCIDPATGTFR